jgi:hypothetical protein
MLSTRVSSRFRNSLFSSAALAATIIAGSANAQSITKIDSTSYAIDDYSSAAQDSNAIAPAGLNIDDYESRARSGATKVPASQPSIVITTPGTSITDRDPVNVTGIGQMVIDEKNGFIGLCTGTLINPRTVIFAAHCVNENVAGTGFQDAWGYGTGPGQLPVVFAFQTNNNVAGNSALSHWLNGTAGGAKYLTSIAEFAYNVNQVQYNALSTKLGTVDPVTGVFTANNFYQGDIAIASLDTPAANVPTWALLFSALPAPSSINDATGTGYHVTIAGYGKTGTPITGAAINVDYRRRLAENYIGLLGSQDDMDVNLFHAEPGGMPQNLYQLDFDSPGDSAAAADRPGRYDFNIFKDNALPKEGTTGSGDSGGPLILDRTYAKQLVIAVLSGGSTYYRGEPSGVWGTTSFYQPLYLYWDYIAAANPYRYVGAVAGDGKWTDPTHWTTLTDPAYNVIADGQLVNGVPTTPGGGLTDTSGKFGQICDGDVCTDINSGVTGPQGAASPPAGSDGSEVVTANDAGRAKIIESEAQDGNSGSPGGEGQAAAAPPLPAPTLANGLPDATDFVPNNIDPDAATKTNARYFDVTLSADGTTTLDGNVTIDNLTINGAGAKLTVAPGASLTSLIAINQLDGLVTNNGMVTSTGDYMLLKGGITGTGRFNAPYFTSVSGMIVPGTMGTTGTMTFGGNLVLASATVQFIDLGANGTSDKLAVVANAGQPGLANVGGFVGFAPVTGYTIRSGDSYTILTSEGGVSGAYSDPVPLSAILTPKFVYSANAVQVQIVAGTYASVVSSRSPVQTAYARLLDGDRANSYNALSTLYGILDLQNQASIQSTLEGLAPRTETLKTAMGTVVLDNISRLYAERLSRMGTGENGGTIAMIGQPLNVIANGSLGALDTTSAAATMGGPQTTVSPMRLPDDMSAFLAGGYLKGDSAPMPTAIPGGGRDDFDGYYVAAGIEKSIHAGSAIGFGLSYTDLKGTTVNGQRVDGKLYQGTLYGKLDLSHGMAVDTQLSAGLFDAHSRRTVSLAGTPFSLSSKDSSLTLNSEVGIRKNIAVGSFTIAPRAAFRNGLIDFSTFIESGGGPALKVQRQRLSSAQARVGLELSGGNTVQPFIKAYYVHDFLDAPAAFGANFVGGLGPNALFALAGRDKDWGEVGGGLSVNAGRIDLSISADTTIDRSDVSNQSYRGSITFHF